MTRSLSYPSSDRLRYASYIMIASLLFASAGLSIATFYFSTSIEIINSLSTILLVTITGIYAFLTWMLVVENRRARREQQSPSFVVNSDIFGPRIENIGNGPAQDLEIVLTLVSEDDRAQTVIKQDGLIPGDHIWVSELPFAAISDGSDKIHTQYDTLSIELSFADMFGRSDTLTLEYNTETLVSDESQKPPEQQIANNLEKINTTLDRMVDSSRETQAQNED